MAMHALPEGVPPSGRVPGQLLQAAPILKRRQRRYKEENGNSRSILGVSSAGTKYKPNGAPRGATGARRVLGAPLGGAAPGTLLESLWWPSSPCLVIPEASGTLIFYIFFPEFLE